MISPIAITGINYDVDARTKKYVEQKVGKLDRYLPRHVRGNVKADVKLAQIDQKNGNKYEAEVILFMPEKTLTAKDSTVNVLAAIDIVEAKLHSQLAKYKELHTVDRSVLSKFKRSFAREAQ